jgi:hypothetical protein
MRASVSPAWRSFTKVPLSQSESSSYPVLILHPLRTSVFPARSTSQPIRIPLLSSVIPSSNRASVFHSTEELHVSTLPLSQSESSSYLVLFLRPMRASAWASVSPAWRSFTKVPLSQSKSSSYPINPPSNEGFCLPACRSFMYVPFGQSESSSYPGLFLRPMRASVFPACRRFLYVPLSQSESSSYPVLFFNPIGHLSFTVREAA